MPEDYDITAIFAGKSKVNPKDIYNILNWYPMKIPNFNSIVMYKGDCLYMSDVYRLFHNKQIKKRMVKEKHEIEWWVIIGLIGVILIPLTLSCFL